MNVEEAVLKQDTRAVARTLIVLQLTGAIVLLLLGDGEDRLRASAMLLGTPIIGVGLYLLERSPCWGKAIVGLGGFPITLLLFAIFPPLGILAAVI